jgi:hypothetical protein
MPDVQNLHEQSIKNLGSGTRKELGQIRKDDFRRPAEDDQ